MREREWVQLTLYYIKINLEKPARVKVEVTLNFLATGSTYRTVVSDDAFH